MAEKLKEILSYTSLSEDTAWDFWSIPFEFLGVKNCNADERDTFSSGVSMKLNIKSKFDPIKQCYYGQPLFQIMTSIFRVLKKTGGNYLKIEDPRERQAVETLINFIQNIEEDSYHVDCLRKLQSVNVRTATNIEAQIQAVMASHLFSPLLSEGKVIVDEIFCKMSEVYSDSETSKDREQTKKVECPFCKVSLTPENTNFGVKDLWHGRPDLVIKTGNVGEAVMVTVDEDYDDDDVDEDYDDDEGCGHGPVTMEIENTECVNDNRFCLAVENSLSAFVHKQLYKKAISLTLMNAFLTVKNDKKLEDKLIPSFLVCQNSIFIHFYNVKRDILLVQSLPMKIVYSDGSINYAAIISIWMTLNFHVFPTEDNEKLYSDPIKSGFEDCLKSKGVLEKYKNEISEYFSEVKDMNTSDDKKHVVSKKLWDELLEMYRLM